MKETIASCIVLLFDPTNWLQSHFVVRRFKLQNYKLVSCPNLLHSSAQCGILQYFIVKVKIRTIAVN